MRVEGAMSQTPAPLDPEAARKARRQKLIGRAIIILLALLLLAQMIPFMMRA